MVAVSFVNSLTGLSAELRGRAYGGGVLEPSEIRSLLLPIVDATSDDLRDLDRRFRARESIDAILESQDKKILASAGINPHDIEVIQNARIHLRNRRLRKTKGSPSDKSSDSPALTA